jgi:hypothetical protein
MSQKVNKRILNDFFLALPGISLFCPKTLIENFAIES